LELALLPDPATLAWFTQLSDIVAWSNLAAPVWDAFPHLALLTLWFEILAHLELVVW